MTQSSSQPIETSVAPDGDMVTFPDGLPGFESCRRFVLIASGDAAPFSVLQAVDPPEPSFLVIDPTIVIKRYRAVLSQSDRLRLHAQDDDPILWLAIVALDADPDADENVTVNLRAPIVINARVMTGFQVMPHQSLYPVRHPLSL